MREQRRAPRFPVALVAEVQELSGTNVWSGRTSDLSRTGCYVDSLNPLPAGTRILIRLLRGRDSFEALAKVVYAAPKLGMGVLFEEPMGELHLETLNRWLTEAASKTKDRH